MQTTLAAQALLALCMVAVTACGGDDGGGDSGGVWSGATTAAATSTVWLSNNEAEPPGGNAMVDAGTPTPRRADQGQEIPAARLGRVIGAVHHGRQRAVASSSTSPPPRYPRSKQGGLVALDSSRTAKPNRGAQSGRSPSSTRRATASSTRCREVEPWMIFYNKASCSRPVSLPCCAAARHVRRVPRNSKTIVDSGAAQAPSGRRRPASSSSSCSTSNRSTQPSRREAARRGREGDLRRRGRHQRLRLSGRRCTPAATRQRRPTTAMPSPKGSRPCRSSAPGPSTAYKDKVDWGSSRSRPSAGTAPDRRTPSPTQERLGLLGLREPGHGVEV